LTRLDETKANIWWCEKQGKMPPFSSCRRHRSWIIAGESYLREEMLFRAKVSRLYRCESDLVFESGNDSKPQCTSPDNRLDGRRAIATRSRRSPQYSQIEVSIRGTFSLFLRKQSDEQGRPRAEVFRSRELRAR